MIFKRFCTGLSLFQEASAEKNRSNLKKAACIMSRLNFLDRESISFVGRPWRATADLALGRVVNMLYRCLETTPATEP